MPDSWIDIGWVKLAFDRDIFIVHQGEARLTGEPVDNGAYRDILI
jgi:hypothetical protein